MLKPYVCVACEKVIVAKDDVASLIGLFSKLIVTAPAGIEIPPNAATPKEWAVFSIWDPEPGDEHREYMLCTQILYPDKSQFGQITKARIKIEPNKRFQMTIQINGFPIGQIGKYTVRIWVEENQRTVFDPIEFGLELEIVRQETAQNPTSAPVPVH
jgi:hypothetical protein